MTYIVNVVYRDERSFSAVWQLSPGLTHLTCCPTAARPQKTAWLFVAGVVVIVAAAAVEVAAHGADLVPGWVTYHPPVWVPLWWEIDYIAAAVTTTGSTNLLT